MTTNATTTELRRCIGSAKFGIEAHDAPVTDFPVQPSQKDGLGRMCRPHWKEYVRALGKARTAAKAGGSAPTAPISNQQRRAMAQAARRLRASGVPVWLDRDDLPPGETDGRLREALASGISGAILVATPNVGIRKTPDAIHDIEAPAILDTLAPQPDFTLVVLNAEALLTGRVDRDAPGRLYGRKDASGYTQYSAIDRTLENMGPELAIDRMHKLRARRGGEALTIDLQTRVAAAAQLHAADLRARSGLTTEQLIYAGRAAGWLVVPSLEPL